MILLGLGLAGLIGLSLGLLGGGGSILTVPILVYVLGFEAKQAIALSLAVVGATSLFGAAGHWRAGNVNVRVALVFGAVAMVGTYLGARLSVFFSGSAQLALFAVVMLVAAVFMFRGRRELEAPATSATAVESLRMPLIAAEGITVGVLTGLVGVGGGFLIVPALVLLAAIPMKEAVGTSLLVIALKSGAGFYGYLGQVEVPWGFLGGFTAVAVAGILVGTYLVRFVPQAHLRRWFAVFLVVMGAFILYQNTVMEMESGMPEQETRDLSGVAARLPYGSHPWPGVIAAGQPRGPDWSVLREAGVRSVLDLREGWEPRGHDEAGAVARAGLEYVNIEFGHGPIADEVFERVRQELRGAEEPVVVHCASANRVGAAMLPYLMLDEGLGEREALEVAVEAGLVSRELAMVALDYVRRTENGRTGS